MGMDLFLETEPEVEIDTNWTASDGRQLIDVLFQSVELIGKHLKDDVGPLKKLGSEELSLEDAAEISEDTGVSPEQMVKDTEQANNAAWQAPEQLAACLRSLIDRIGEHGKNLPLAQLKKNYHDRKYFEKDVFLADLKDLLRWTEEAQKAGVKRVRI
jgi:hypothetical protein